jgi:hypothetical protein
VASAGGASGDVGTPFERDARPTWRPSPIAVEAMQRRE